MPKRGQRKKNRYKLYGKVGIGYDSNNKKFYFDIEDFDKIKHYTWYVGKSAVITKIEQNRTLFMHRFIMDYNGKLTVDHKNHLINDNRKSNLRLANKIQNGQNRKNAKGWRFENKKNRFSARIVVNKKEIHLGYFDNEILAREAYLKSRKKYFKEFCPEDK